MVHYIRFFSQDDNYKGLRFKHEISRSVQDFERSDWERGETRDELLDRPAPAWLDRVFKIPGILKVSIEPLMLWITKDDSADWKEIIDAIETVL